MNEKNVVAGILIKTEYFEEAKNILRSEDFSDYTYRSIFSECEKIYQEEGNITLDKIIARLGEKDNQIYEKIVNLMGETFDYIDFLSSCQKVREFSKKQKMLEANKELEKILKNTDGFKNEEIESYPETPFEKNKR